MSDSPWYDMASRYGIQFKLVMRSNNYNEDEEEGDVNNNNNNNNNDDNDIDNDNQDKFSRGQFLLDSW